MSEEAIRVEGVSFAYGDVKAVDDISFSVAQGEVMGFLGPNGAGKSTTHQAAHRPDAPAGRHDLNLGNGRRQRTRRHAGPHRRVFRREEPLPQPFRQ